MNAASVASELDFNNENASMTLESGILSEEADSIDLGQVANITDLRLKHEKKLNENSKRST